MYAGGKKPRKSRKAKQANQVDPSGTVEIHVGGKQVGKGHRKKAKSLLVNRRGTLNVVEVESAWGSGEGSEKSTSDKPLVESTTEP